MDTFYTEQYQKDGTWDIICRIIIYREQFGKHPDFLKDYAGSEKHGFNTKFFLLIKTGIETKDEAERQIKKLTRRYEGTIARCENTGRWDDFPFMHCPVLYYK